MTRLIQIEDGSGYWLWDDGIHRIAWDSIDHAALVWYREKRATENYRDKSALVDMRYNCAIPANRDRRAVITWRDKRAIGVNEL